MFFKLIDKSRPGKPPKFTITARVCRNVTKAHAGSSFLMVTGMPFNMGVGFMCFPLLLVLVSALKNSLCKHANICFLNVQKFYEVSQEYYCNNQKVFFVLITTLIRQDFRSVILIFLCAKIL